MKQKGYAASTLTTAARVLEAYASWLRNSFDARVTDAQEPHIEKYIGHLKERLAPGSLRLSLSRLRRFYRYLYRKEFILKDPTFSILPLKKEQKALLKNVPDEEAVSYLLNQPDEHTYHGLRDKAILELLYSSGLRNEELRNLALRDIDLKEKVVTVCRGKGGKGRMVPFGKKAQDSIQKYLEITRPKYAKTPEEEHLFLTERGDPLAHHKTCVNSVLSYYKKRSALTKHISPHTLRHAFALHLLRGGATIQAVQTLLGHKLLSTTQVYTRLYPKDLKAIHKKYHPRERNPS
jgi:integrase/recombinase XerD